VELAYISDAGGDNEARWWEVALVDFSEPSFGR
jgi:hypothetical protein